MANFLSLSSKVVAGQLCFTTLVTPGLASASDMPANIPGLGWLAALLIACLPAFVLVTIAMARAIAALVKKSSHRLETLDYWIIWATHLSLVPWYILLVWFAISQPHSGATR
ncbi:hypothetical protein HNQ52_002607 [Chiayiivirga flava]|uniref:Uncharacterized protein n=1 Tax=Chiayiivirga flava TaxID=659595 RepID=A0A7W8D947_9GAMM|nr:hypothetical protein [Chiayiivirga flava]